MSGHLGYLNGIMACTGLSQLPKVAIKQASRISSTVLLRGGIHSSSFKAYCSCRQPCHQYGSISNQFLGGLERIVGSTNVSTTEAHRQLHGHDESYHRSGMPDVVVFPESTSHVSELVHLCSAHTIPVIPYGTGTGLEGGVIATRGGVSVDMVKMDKVVAVNNEDFDVTVQPGITRKSLNRYLRDTGLWFPIDPGADASLCGMCATSASGTNAVRYGTMKDNTLNLEVVLPDGTIIHTAGEGRHTKKTAAGYNLTNLFVGSEGTLGIITAATLKLYGIPESTLAAVCHFPSIQAAVDTTVQVLQSGVHVARIEFLDACAMQIVSEYHDLGYQIAPSLFMEFHGSEVVVQEQAQVVGELVKYNGGSGFDWATDEQKRNRLWTARHDFYNCARKQQPNSLGYSTDVCVPISHLPDVMTQTSEDAQSLGIAAPLIGHVGDGNFHAVIVGDFNNPKVLANLKSFTNRLADRALAVGGTCTGEHGVGIGKRHLLVKEFGQATIDVMKLLKVTFDPKNIMNPGKVLY